MTATCNLSLVYVDGGLGAQQENDEGCGPKKMTEEDSPASQTATPPPAPQPDIHPDTEDINASQGVGQ